MLSKRFPIQHILRSFSLAISNAAKNELALNAQQLRDDARFKFLSSCKNEGGTAILLDCWHLARCGTRVALGKEDSPNDMPATVSHMVPTLISLWVQGTGIVLLALVCCTLFLSRRRDFFGYWSISWTCLASAGFLQATTQVLARSDSAAAFLASGLRDAATLGHFASLVSWVRGIFQYQVALGGKPGQARLWPSWRRAFASRGVGISLCLAACFALVLVQRLLPTTMFGIVVATSLALVWSWSGAVLLAVRRSPAVIAMIALLTLGFLVQMQQVILHCWELVAGTPLSHEYAEWIARINYLFQVLLAAGMIALLLEEDRRALRDALQRLSESEGRFRMMFEHGGVGMALLTADGRCVEVNPALERMFGYTSAEMHGRHLADFGHPEEHTMRFHFDRPAQGIVSQDERERRYLHKDGRIVWVHLIRVHVTDAAGHLGHAVSVLVDITARRQAEEQLRGECDFSNQILQTADALILVLDPAGGIVRCNEKYAAVSGYSPKEAKGQLLWDSFASTHSEDTVREVFQRLQESAVPCFLECTCRTRSNEERIIAWRFSAVQDELGFVKYVIGAGLDVTDQRRLEEQLRHAQKMETLGTLVGGIAHDFNNQLTAILGNVGLALLEIHGLVEQRLSTPQLPAGVQAALATLPTLVTPLEDAENAAQRCADMSRRLLAFSRSRIGQTQLVNLNELVTEITRLLKRVLPATIQVEVQADPDLLLVKADSTQLHQVLMNLAVNARDAMPQGGRLTLSTTNCMLTTADCTRNVEARPGRFVVLSVTDTGSGIAPDVLARIFEPFFTTKDADKGTGLGLAMVFGTVKAHRGWIVVDSEPGKGTTFAIFLPARTPDCRSKDGLTSTRAANALAPVSSGCILVVDDEQLIRNYTSCLLERVGYQVLLAADGEEALRVYAQRADQIDAVILDLTMPRMSGHEALEELRAINPAVKVIFSSGYAPRKETEELLAAGTSAFVAKPYQPQELLRVLRSVLDPKPARVIDYVPEPVGS